MRMMSTRTVKSARVGLMDGMAQRVMVGMCMERKVQQDDHLLDGCCRCG